jgi:hypothetical protein
VTGTGTGSETLNINAVMDVVGPNYWDHTTMNRMFQQGAIRLLDSTY